MPINRLICPVCRYEKEYLTQNVREEIPTQRCEKCGRELLRSIGLPHYRLALKEGVWEKGEDGQEHYKGKGGRSIPLHKDGTPIV